RCTALLARVIGVGIEAADMLAHEMLSSDFRDRRVVARYAGLTGSPDERGSRRRKKGLAKAGSCGLAQQACRPADQRWSSAAGAPRTSAGTRDHERHQSGRRALSAGARPCRRRSKAHPLFIGDSAALCTKSLEVLIPILYLKGVSIGGQGCR